MSEHTLLVTVDSLRYDHYQYMEKTREYLGESHPAAFATSTATPGSFQSIITGKFPTEAGIDPSESVIQYFQDLDSIAISTNRFISDRYGYAEGFSQFTEPARETGIKEMVARNMSPNSVLWSVATRVWNIFQTIKSTSGGEGSREYREARDVIDEFLTYTDGTESWFGWLHLMEPHHPYNPEGDISRVEAQQITRRLLAGNGSEEDEEIARRLYRGEVEELDDRLAKLWDETPEDTEVVFVADHGELLGEYGEWGHHANLCPELLHIPLATRNIPVESDVLSILDIPALLYGESHNEGVLNREIAYAARDGEFAAMNQNHMATSDNGTLDIRTGETVSNRQLEQALSVFRESAGGIVTLDELPHDDLEALGYL